MRNFALFSAATWRIRHAGRQTWAEVNKKKWLFGPGGLKHWVTHGPVAGVNALSIQAKTNPNQAKQNPKKKIANKKKSHNIKFQSGFHGKLLYSLDFFFASRNNWIFSVLSHACSNALHHPLPSIHHGQHVSLQLVKDFSIFSSIYVYIFLFFQIFFICLSFL